MKHLLLVTLLLAAAPLLARDSDIVWGENDGGIVLGVPRRTAIADAAPMQPITVFIRNTSPRQAAVSFRGRFQCLALFLLNPNGKNFPLDPVPSGPGSLRAIPPRGTLRIDTRVPVAELRGYVKPLLASVSVLTSWDGKFREVLSPEIRFSGKN